MLCLKKVGLQSKDIPRVTTNYTQGTFQAGQRGLKTLLSSASSHQLTDELSLFYISHLHTLFKLQEPVFTRPLLVSKLNVIVMFYIK